jgi:hypothetical protein
MVVPEIVPMQHINKLVDASCQDTTKVVESILAHWTPDIAFIEKSYSLP